MHIDILNGVLTGGCLMQHNSIAESSYRSFLQCYCAALSMQFPVFLSLSFIHVVIRLSEIFFCKFRFCRVIYSVNNVDQDLKMKENLDQSPYTMSDLYITDIV